MSDTRKSEKTTASLDTDVSALMEEFTKGGKRSASRSKSSAPIDKKLSVEEFTELDISPDFKPIRSDVPGQEDQVGKAVAAFGGEEEAEIEKAAPMTQPAAAVASPAAAPVAPITDVAPANEDRPARSKLPIAAAAVASLALVGVLGAQSWKSASAVEVVGYAAAPPATPSHSQLNMATSAAEIIPQPTSTQLAMAEPSQSRGIAIPVQPSATNVGLQAPAPALTTGTAAPQIEQTAKFTPLPSETKPRMAQTPSLSRSDCAARYKTVSRSGAINFESGSATLVESSEPILHFFANVYAHCQDFDIVVAGHTDAVGGANFNKALSVRRAASVAQYLVGLGVPSGSMRVVGYGETQPIATNDTALRRSRNRRIEFMIEDG